MQKKICDECGKEIEEESSWYLFGYLEAPLTFEIIEKDFCSLECLHKFVEKLKGGNLKNEGKNNK